MESGGVMVKRAMIVVSSFAVLAPAALGATSVVQTTEPQAVRLDTVVLGKSSIRLGFTAIQRGGLVVFKVHNASTQKERFVIAPATVGIGPAQGGSGFRTKLMKPGEFTSFQIEFQTRQTFRYSSVDSAGKRQSAGQFMVT